MLIRQRIDQLRLTPRQLCMSLKHLHRLVNLTLLEAELRERSHGSLTLRVDAESLVATPFGGGDVLLPLVKGETFVDEWENILCRSGTTK